MAHICGHRSTAATQRDVLFNNRHHNENTNAIANVCVCVLNNKTMLSSNTGSTLGRCCKRCVDSAGNCCCHKRSHTSIGCQQQAAPSQCVQANEFCKRGAQLRRRSCRCWHDTFIWPINGVVSSCPCQYDCWAVAVSGSWRQPTWD